jgi:pimeloyl-ACP methyl ester carboxylesterase
VKGFDERDTADFEPLLDRVTIPTCIIWGAHDAWIDPKISAEILSRLPAADRVLVPDAGHFSPEDEPARVAQTLDDFLA